MSHFCSVRTAITDRELLMKSLKQTGCSIGKNEILVSRCGYTTKEGIEISLSRADWGEHPRCGFYFDEGHYKFVAYDGSHEDMGDIFNQVISSYMTEKALQDSALLRQRGATVNVVVH